MSWTVNHFLLYPFWKYVLWKNRVLKHLYVKRYRSIKRCRLFAGTNSYKKYWRKSRLWVLLADEFNSSSYSVKISMCFQPDFHWIPMECRSHRSNARRSSRNRALLRHLLYAGNRQKLTRSRAPLLHRRCSLLTTAGAGNLLRWLR